MQEEEQGDIMYDNCPRMRDEVGFNGATSIGRETDEIRFVICVGAENDDLKFFLRSRKKLVKKRSMLESDFLEKIELGASWESNPGPLTPEARILPLDHTPWGKSVLVNDRVVV